MKRIFKLFLREEIPVSLGLELSYPHKESKEEYSIYFLYLSPLLLMKIEPNLDNQSIQKFT